MVCETVAEDHYERPNRPSTLHLNPSPNQRLRTGVLRRALRRWGERIAQHGAQGHTFGALGPRPSVQRRRPPCKPAGASYDLAAAFGAGLHAAVDVVGLAADGTAVRACRAGPRPAEGDRLVETARPVHVGAWLAAGRLGHVHPAPHAHHRHGYFLLAEAANGRTPAGCPPREGHAAEGGTAGAVELGRRPRPGGPPGGCAGSRAGRSERRSRSPRRRARCGSRDASPRLGAEEGTRARRGARRRHRRVAGDAWCGRARPRTPPPALVSTPGRSYAAPFLVDTTASTGAMRASGRAFSPQIST